jgi:hypothetical protein
MFFVARVLKTALVERANIFEFVSCGGGGKTKWKLKEKELERSRVRTNKNLVEINSFFFF